MSTPGDKRKKAILDAMMALDSDRSVGDHEYVEIMEAVEEQAGASARAKQEEIRREEQEMFSAEADED